MVKISSPSKTCDKSDNGKDFNILREWRGEVLGPGYKSLKWIVVGLQPLQYNFRQAISVSMGHFKNVDILPLSDLPDEIIPL